MSCRESGLPTTPLQSEETTASSSAHRRRILDPLGSIKAASERIVIDGRPIVLSTDAWRNFAPAPPGPRPLIVALRLTASSQGFPDGLRADRVWVFHRDETWSTQTLELIPIEPGNGAAAAVIYVARGGPEWPTNDPIDVAVRMTMPNGAVYFLQNRGIRIGAPS